MSLSALERRELLALANGFEAFFESPDMIASLASVLRTWVDGKVRVVAEPSEQLPLCGELVIVPVERRSRIAPERIPPVERTVESAPKTTEENSTQPRSMSHRGLSSVESPPSSSDLDLTKREKKTERIRPCIDDPLPADFRSAYAEVVAERGVMLPSANYVWTKFVEDLWDRDITFATRWNLKRKWRSWCWYEDAVTEAPPAASSETRPIAKVAAVDPEERSRRTERSLLEQRAREDLEHAKALPGLRAGCAMVLGVFGPRAPPVPRSASA